MSRPRLTAMTVTAILALSVPAGIRAQSPAPPAASGAPDQPAADWPVLRGDPGRSGLGSDGPHGEPVLRWRYQAEGAANQPVVTSPDLAYTSTDEGTLHALSLADGSQRWSWLPEHLPASAAALEGGTLYVFDGIGTLFALDPATGAERWHADTSVGAPTQPTFGDGMLLVTGDDNAVHALSLTDGSERWRYAVPGGAGLHNVAFADGMVAVAADTGGYTGLDAATGTERWHHDLGGDPSGTAVIAEGVAFVGASGDGGGHLDALDAATGTLLWSDPESLFSPAVAEGVAVSPGSTGAVVAHDVRTGRELWRTPVTGNTRPLAIADGTVFVGADDQHLVLGLDLHTGAERWSFPVDAGIDCCVGVARGVVLLGTGNGSVYAIGGKDDPTRTPMPSAPAATAGPGTSPAPTAGPASGIERVDWTTGPLTEDQVAAAYVAAGGTDADGRTFFRQLGGTFPRDHATIGLRLDGGFLTQMEQGGDHPAIVGSRGRYTLSGSRFTITDPIDGTFTFDVDAAPGMLRLTPTDTWPDAPWTATLFGSFAFHDAAAPDAASPRPSPMAAVPDGRYVTAPIPVDTVRAAIRDAGFDPAAWDPGPVATIVNALEFDGGRLRVLGAGDDQVLGVGWNGRYHVVDDHTIEAGDAISTIDYTYSIDGDRLTMRMVSDSLQEAGELAAQASIYDSAPFLACGDLSWGDCRAAAAGEFAAASTAPAASATAFDPAILDGTWTTPVTQADLERAGLPGDPCVGPGRAGTLILRIDQGHYIFGETCAGVAFSIGDKGLIQVTPDTFTHLPDGGPARGDFDWRLDGDTLHLAYRDSVGLRSDDIRHEHLGWEHDWTRASASTTSPAPR
jgi:outer membrane protein assembly factor BamB